MTTKIEQFRAICRRFAQAEMTPHGELSLTHEKKVSLPVRGLIGSVHAYLDLSSGTFHVRVNVESAHNICDEEADKYLRAVGELFELAAECGLATQTFRLSLEDRPAFMLALIKAE